MLLYTLGPKGLAVVSKVTTPELHVLHSCVPAAWNPVNSVLCRFPTFVIVHHVLDFLRQLPILRNVGPIHLKRDVFTHYKVVFNRRQCLFDSVLFGVDVHKLLAVIRHHLLLILR